MSGSSADRLGARSSSAASASRARSAAARASARRRPPARAATAPRRELLARCGAVGADADAAAAEPRHDHLGRLRTRDGVGRLSGGIALEAERRRSSPRARLPLGADRETRSERLLEARRRRAPARGPVSSARRSVDEPAEQGRVDVPLAQMRDRRERLLRRAAARGLVGCARRRRRPGVELVCLVGQRPAAGIHLQQHRLGRLAREPELAALGVVAVALGRDHRSVRRRRAAASAGRARRPRAAAARPGRRRRARAAAALRRPAAAGAACSRSTTTARLPSPSRRARSSSSSAAFRVAREHGGRTPGQRRRDCALGARLRFERESASVSPASASARAAGEIPSRSAIARSSACKPLAAERARSATSSRSVAAARAAAAASFARCSSSAGAGPPRRAIARASSRSGASASTSAADGFAAQRRAAREPRRVRRVGRWRPPGRRSPLRARPRRRPLGAQLRERRLRPAASAPLVAATTRVRETRPLGRLAVRLGRVARGRGGRRSSILEPRTPSSLRSAAARSASVRSSRSRASSPAADSRRSARRSLAP